MKKQLEEAVAQLATTRAEWEAVGVDKPDADLEDVRGRLREVEARLRSCDAADEMALAGEAAALRAILEARINGWLARRREVEPARKALARAEAKLQSLVSADYEAAITKGAAGRERLLGELYDGLDELDRLSGEIARRYLIGPRRRPAVIQWRRTADELARVLGLKRRPSPSAKVAGGKEEG